MTTYAFGNAAGAALALAQFERADDRYINGHSCWRLTDLRGNAKNWAGSYARTRNNALDAVQAAALRFGCVATLDGKIVNIYSRGKLIRARKRIEPFVIHDPAAAGMTYFVIDPSPALLRRVLRGRPNDAGYIMGLGDTVVAVAMREPMKRLAKNDVITRKHGNRSRYATVHILNAFSKCASRPTAEHKDRANKHRTSERERVAREYAEARAARQESANRFPFRLKIVQGYEAVVLETLKECGAPYGLHGGDVFTNQDGAVMLRLKHSFRAVRHREAA